MQSLRLLCSLQRSILTLTLTVVVTFLTMFIYSACYAEKIFNFSTESSPEAIRLNFNVEGGFPQKVETKTVPKITVMFKELQVEESVKNSLSMLPPVVESINFVEGSNGVMEIILSDQKAQVEYLILPVLGPPKPGSYRLVIDIVPSVKLGMPSKPTAPPIEKLLEEEAKRLEKEKISLTEKKEKRESLPTGEIPFEEMFFVEASKAYNAEDYERSIKLYRRYIERAKGEYINEARYGLALSLYKFHEQELAQFGTEIAEALQQALEHLPNDPRAPLARCFLASVLFQSGMKKRAQNILEELLQAPISGDSSLCVWKTMGEIYLKNANYIEAIKAFYEALKTNPSPKDAALIYMLMGKTLSDGGVYRQAIVNLRRAVELYPPLYLDRPDFLKILGEALFGMQNYQGALQAFLWYLNLSPQAPSDDMLWAYIAETLLQTHREAIAERVQNSIITNMPDTEGGYLTLLRKAQKLEEKGKIEQALAIYEDLAKKQLPDALAYIHRFRWALLLKNQKRFPEAVTEIENFTQHLSGKKEISSTLEDLRELKNEILRGWLIEEYRGGKYQQVIEIYNGYRGELSEDGPVLEALAMSFYKEKDCATALNFLNKLLAVIPKPPKEWLVASAYCAYVTGDINRAETLFRQIPDLDKDHALIFARLLMIKKKYAEARKIFEKLITSHGPEKETVSSLLECLIEQKDCYSALHLISNTVENITDFDQAEQFKILKLKIQCLEALKKTPELIDSLTKAINTAPNQEEKCALIYKLYNLYVSTKRQAESESALKQLAQCDNPFWKKVGEEGLRYLEFLKKTEGIKKIDGTTGEKL